MSAPSSPLGLGLYFIDVLACLLFCLTLALVGARFARAPGVNMFAGLISTYLALITYLQCTPVTYLSPTLQVGHERQVSACKSGEHV